MMANSENCKKGKRNSPSDQRRRAAVEAERRVKDASPKPDYSPKKPVQAVASARSSAISASVLLSSPHNGEYNIKEIEGLRVEVLSNMHGLPSIRILGLPDGHSDLEVWKKDSKTFLPMKFIAKPKFTSKVPAETMRGVQQLIYGLFRPYWKDVEISEEGLPADVPQTALGLALKYFKVEKPAPSGNIRAFYKGQMGEYAFPVKGPKAVFVVENLSGTPGYRLMSVEEGNPLSGVKVPIVLSRNQVIGEAGVSKNTKARGGEKMRQMLRNFFASFGYDVEGGKPAQV